MKIGELAELVGVRPSAIRYYESEGLLVPAERRGGKRVYTASSVGELRMLLGAQRAGLSLAEIRGLLPAFRDQRSLSRSWRAVAERKLAELRDVQAALRATRRFLQRSLACDCETSGVCELARAIDGMTNPVRSRSSSIASTRRAARPRDAKPKNGNRR